MQSKDVKETAAAQKAPPGPAPLKATPGPAPLKATPAPAGGLVMVLTPPGGVDANGGYKNSVPLSTLTPVNGGGENIFYGFGLTWGGPNVIGVLGGTLSLENGDSYYKSTVKGNLPQSVNITIQGLYGLDTGVATMGTWYYVWYIVNPTTGADSAIFSLSNTSPTLPTGYTLKRRIGSIRTAATAASIEEFSQIGTGPSKTYYKAIATRVLTNGSNTTPTMIDLSAGVSPLATTGLFSGTLTLGSNIQSGYGIARIFGGGVLSIPIGAITGFCEAGASIDYLAAPLQIRTINSTLTYIIESTLDTASLTLDTFGWTEEL